MPSDPKIARYHKRSRSSSSQRQHRNRDRRPYDKEKSDRYDRYQWRSRSRSPARPQSQKSKYTLQYQYKAEKRYEQPYRETDKGKYYESAHNKSYDNASSKLYESNSNRNYQFEKRDREKGDEYNNKPRYNRYQENQNYKNRDRQQSYERRDRQRSSPERDRKRRRSSSSRSRSKSPKQSRPDFKIVPNKISPPQKQKIPQAPPKQQRQQQPQRERFFPPPPPPPPARGEMQAVEKKINKQFQNISPIKRMAIIEARQLRQEEPITKTKVDRFDLVMNEARQNLAVTPPPSSFLLLETFRNMNKFQVETLDPKWMNFLKKDMEKYAQVREATMSKLAEQTEGTIQQGRYIFSKQILWMKEQRNEQELDLRFKFQQFKQHNAILNQCMRKLRFSD